MDRDAFAEAADALNLVPYTDEPFSISNGVTIVDITRHPVYGTALVCRAWMAHMPWTLRVKARAVAYRGDLWNRDSEPERLGESTITRIRKGANDVREVSVGLVGGEPELTLFLAGSLSLKSGDTLAFDRP